MARRAVKKAKTICQKTELHQEPPPPLVEDPVTDMEDFDSTFPRAVVYSEKEANRMA
jgi:hypothetical protein